MHLASSVEIRKIYLCTKAKSWHQFISVIIQHNIANLMKGFFVLALLGWSDVVKRGRLILNTIASSEIDANHHCHLHATGKEICKIVLDCLFEALDQE